MTEITCNCSECLNCLDNRCTADKISIDAIKQFHEGCKNDYYTWEFDCDNYENKRYKSG